jgi:dolichol-phosphate mannosyltransferase
MDQRSAAAQTRFRAMGSRPCRRLTSVLLSPPIAMTSALDAPTGPLRIAPLPSGQAPLRLSLVVPTFNEATNVVTLLTMLEKLLAPVLGDAFEIIVVDDDSPDGTWQKVEAALPEHPHVRLIRRQSERGLSTAVIRGWQVARGEILGVMDADLQHPVEANLALLNEIDRGADLAVASRHTEGGGVSDWSAARRVVSRGAQLLGLLLLPGVLGRLSDPMSGYFMLRRQAIEGVELSPLGYKILIEVVARGRVRWIGETGYVFRERKEGESKVTPALYWEYVRHLIRLRWWTLPESRLFRFCVVGGSGVVVDMGLLFLLSDPKVLGLGLTRSKLLAAETAIGTNFLLNDAWTFGDLARQAPGAKSKFRRFLGYNLICTAGVLLNVVFLNLLFNLAHMNRYLANGIAIVAVTFWNYGLNRKLNWAPVKASTPPPGSR